MYYSIDRIEGSIAICEGEDRSTLRVPVEKILPAPGSPNTPPREGDMLLSTPEGLRIDPEETAKRRAAAAALLRGLIKK